MLRSKSAAPDFCASANVSELAVGNQAIPRLVGSGELFEAFHKKSDPASLCS